MTAINESPEAVVKRRRLRFLAAMDGWSLVVGGGLCLALSLVWLSASGLAFGVAILGAGLLELRGRRWLASPGEEPRARRLLVLSQLAILLVILAYCAWRISMIDLATILPSLSRDLQAMLLQSCQCREEELVWLLNLMARFFYGLVMVLSLLYQGGMAAWYAWRLRRGGGLTA